MNNHGVNKMKKELHTLIKDSKSDQHLLLPIIYEIPLETMKEYLIKNVILKIGF